MAIGDAAAGEGMDLVPDTDDRRDGYLEINKTRDYISTITKDASRLSSGLLPSARIPSHSADLLTSGVVTRSVQNISTQNEMARLQLSDAPAGPAYAVRKDYVDAVAGAADTVTPTAYARTSGAVKFAMWMDANYDIVRNTSSRRYKDAIEPAQVDVAAVLALEPVTYHLKADSDPALRELGLIAEDCTDVEHLVAYDVPRNRDGAPRKGAKPRPEAVRYEQALPVALLAVVKHQAQLIEQLTDRVARLEQA